jgi:hypothetical protein
MTYSYTVLIGMFKPWLLFACNKSINVAPSAPDALKHAGYFSR